MIMTTFFGHGSQMVRNDNFIVILSQLDLILNEAFFNLNIFRKVTEVGGSIIFWWSVIISSNNTAWSDIVKIQNDVTRFYSF